MLSASLRRVAARTPALRNVSHWRSMCASKHLANGTAQSPDQLLETLGESDMRGELSKLRDSENELMTAIRRDPVEINWEDWKTKISYPGLIDELKKELDSAPEPDISEDIKAAEKEVNSLFDPIIAQYEKMAIDAQNDTAEIEKQLAEISFIRDNIKDLSLEEFFRRYPKIKDNIQKDVLDNKWFIE